MGWRQSMEAALYGDGGFFTRADDGPADHFRTSVHASPLFASALLRLIERIDDALGGPDFDVVDVGAGRGELLAVLRDALPGRFRLTGVERAPRPAGLDPRIGWRPDLPDRITGLLLATEWLDNVPLDVAESDDHGRWRVAYPDGTLGPEPDDADRHWLARWWPAPDGPGERAEIGRPRDVAWADAVGRVERGGALAVDYGHLLADRPRFGTLTGYRGGRQVPPVPDGSCDLTAHVALDSAAVAAQRPYHLVTQRTALRALGVDGARPPLDLARTDPAGYLRTLAAAGAAGELTDPAGLGGHRWLLHTIGTGNRGSMVT